MDKVTKRLFEMQDLGYRDFHAKLVPTVNKEAIIGVRTPLLRAYAKELAKDPDKHLFLRELPHHYVEENSLHASLIASISTDIDVVLKHIDGFLPYIDNWATCDSFASKIFKKHPEKISNKLDEWLKSTHTYTIRFAVVTAMQYFLDEHFDKSMLYKLASIRTDEYYINMAIAWYYSVALVKQYESTILLLENRALDKWVHNKSIQKAVESYRIGAEQKEYLKSLRIKR